MARLKSYAPTTPGRRGLVLQSRAGLHKGAPEKSLVRGLPRKGGRNNTGRITARRIGGGHKRLYRTVDFRRANHDEEATVVRLEYDPCRSAYLALLSYGSGEEARPSYILAPQRLAPGDKVMAGQNASIRPGNALPLSSIPLGTLVHNVEMKPGKGGQLARAAGTYIQLAGRDGGYAQLKLRSGELRVVPEKCYATIGEVSNPDRKNEKLGKAGRKRWRGKRPEVRGVAMNPVDHPHGGGEGRTSGGRHPVTPWGVSTKGKRTRRPQASDKYIIRRRYKK